jgi:hypothetical protein
MADAGAEAAELERWSVYTIAIGGKASVDGEWSAVDLSIGKGRLGGGDMVHPGRYCGRTGAWRLVGDARSAAEVKAERATKNTDKRVETLVYAIPSMLDALAESLSMKVIRGNVGGRDEHVRAACRTLLDTATGEPLDVVEVRKRVSGAYKLWTRRRAEEAHIAIVPRSATATGNPQ